MVDIDGKNWMSRYNTRNTDTYTNKVNQGNLASTMYGITSVLNTGLGVASWFVFLTDYRNNTLHWYTWFTFFLSEIILWFPILVTWPVTYFGSTMSVNFLQIFAQMSLAGPFGIYEGVIAAILVTDIFMRDWSGYTGDITMAWIYFGSYCGLAVFNSFVSLFWVQDIIDWYQELKAADEYEAYLAELEKE